MKSNIQPLPIEIYVNIIMHNEHPSIQLGRKIKSDNKLSKEIIYCALNEIPLVFIPRFTDKIKSIGNLIDKGVMYIDDDGNYCFVE